MRKRRIKKVGNSWFIKLDPADVRDFGFVEGDLVDVDDLNLLEQEKIKKASASAIRKKTYKSKRVKNGSNKK